MSTDDNALREEYRALARKNIRNAEGYRASPYFDTMGNLTVGIGHVLKAGGIAFPGRAIEALFDELSLIHI